MITSKCVCGLGNPARRQHVPQDFAGNLFAWTPRISRPAEKKPPVALGGGRL
jgi:hypothetical protein